MSGPLGPDGKKITPGDAVKLGSPLPPTNDITGDLAGVWLDSNGQFGWVWNTDLTFYVNSLNDTTEAQLTDDWAEKVSSDPEYALLQVGKNPGIGRNYDPGSSLAWTDGAQIFSFVAFTQTLDEVVTVAEQVS